MGDPRKNKRMPINLSCCLYYENDPTPVQTTVLDISFGGMGVVATKALKAGDLLEFRHSDFPCLPTKTISSKCRVISIRSAKGNSNGFRIGLAFEPPDVEFIQNLLEWTQMQTLVQKLFQQRAAPATSLSTTQPQETIERLEREINTLRNLIPICCSCKKVRNDRGYWEQIEAYAHTGCGTEFTHSICPECRTKLYPGMPTK